MYVDVDESLSVAFSIQGMQYINKKKGCLSEKQMKNMFPQNRNKKKREKFKVNHARTSRYQYSTIIHMQKLLNTDSEEKRKISERINRACSREERLQFSSRYL